MTAVCFEQPVLEYFTWLVTELNKIIFDSDFEHVIKRAISHLEILSFSKGTAISLQLL